MQIGAQQDAAISGAWQRAERGDPFACEIGIEAAGAVVEIELEPVGPLIAHLLERAERMIRWRLPVPQAAHQPGEDHVLLGFR